MNIVVTGGAGFIGSNVVRELVSRGHTVAVLDSFETGLRSKLEGVEADVYEGDIRDREDVRRSLKGADAVVHEAAVTSVPESIEKPARTSDVNCTGTAIVLEEARDAGVKKFVVASSAAVYGGGTPPLSEGDRVSPESPYAQSKLWTERLTRGFDDNHGVETVALRYFNVYGAGQDADSEYAAVVPAFVSAAVNRDTPVVYGDGEQTRDFVHVRDVASATAEAVESDAIGVYNVASGEETSVNQLLQTVLKESDVDVEPRYEEPRKGDIRRSYADVSKIRDEMGFEPSVGLREGVRSVVESFRERNAR